jgi:hypothetical protein
MSTALCWPALPYIQGSEREVCSMCDTRHFNAGRCRA